MEKIILDCDPGMDDSVAMIMAMNASSLSLMAVTTVNGNYPADVTAKNALKVRELMGRDDIPVAKGMSSPMVRKAPADPFTHGSDGLAESNLAEPKGALSSLHAVELIAKIVKENPDEVTIVSTAPMSNIAMAMKMYPEMVPHIKGIVAISGAFGLNQASFLNATGDTPQSEWNVYVDPEAARIVYESGVPLRLIGLDIATDFGVDFSDEDIRTLEKKEGSGASFLLNAIRFVRKRGFGAYCAVIDAMAVAYVMDNSLIEFKKYHVGVDTRDGLTLGMTVRDGRHHFIWENLPLLDVAVHADYKKFLNMILETV